MKESEKHMAHILPLWARLKQRRSTYFLLSALECSGLFFSSWFVLTFLVHERYAAIIAGIAALGCLAFCIIGDYLAAYSQKHIERYSYPGLHVRNVTPYHWFRLAYVVLGLLALFVYSFLRYQHLLP